MKWISLEKKYPQPDTGVIVTDGVRVWSAQWFRIGESTYWNCHGYSGYDMEAEFDNPTHWMPLPEPPSNLTPLAPDRLRRGRAAVNPLQSTKKAEVSPAKHGGR